MFEIEKVMNRIKVAEAIHTLLDTGIGILNKKTLDKDDFGKLKVMRTMSSNINASVMMIQQETAQQRTAIVIERMKQLGYGEPKQIEN